MEYYYLVKAYPRRTILPLLRCLTIVTAATLAVTSAHARPQEPANGRARYSFSVESDELLLQRRIAHALEDAVEAQAGIPGILRVPRSSPPELDALVIPDPGPHGSYLVSGSRKMLGILSLQKPLQERVQSLIHKAASSHVSAVVMEPGTGRILAAAGKSDSLESPLLHSEFPAASLFKIITSAAALEQKALDPHSSVAFRGGTYTLNRHNYLPNSTLDNKFMMLSEALGRSCNPVFARVALQHLSPALLRQYTNYFGFNRPLEFDAYLPQSRARIPDTAYDFSRTAAGFGDVSISPIHAASFVAALANNGLMPRPSVIDLVVNKKGKVLYRQEPEHLGRAVLPETARSLLNMMEKTTTVGTSRSAFTKAARENIGPVRVAGKTGTLTGSSPRGLTRWFVAAAPVVNPEVVIAVVAVEPWARSSHPSSLGRKILEYAL